MPNAADIVFTSGATESNNLAITGTARAALARGAKPHVITLATEHKSVLETVRALESQGVAVTILMPDATGLLDRGRARSRNPADDLPRVAAACEQRDWRGTGSRRHSQRLRRAWRSAAHRLLRRARASCRIDVAGIALLSFTAHKLGGPQGIGALYVSPAHRGRIQAQMLGGGHERGLRAGTLATHQIVGFRPGLRAGRATARSRGRARRGPARTALVRTARTARVPC